MSLGTSNRDGGKTSESGHLRALGKIVTGDVIEGLVVAQRAAGVNMSVDISAGDAFVRRADGSYAHPVFNDAVYNQAISTADGSNPRNDIVVIYVDYAETPSTEVSNNTNGVVKIKVVDGTPAGSPADPDDAAIQSSVGSGNPWTKLARVRVPASQSSINNSLIDDLRSMTQPIIPDGSVSAEMLGLTPTTDANGWSVRDYGGYKEYIKVFTGVSFNIAAQSGSSVLTSQAFPVGVAPDAVVPTVTTGRPSGDNHEYLNGTINTDFNSSSTSATFDVRMRNIAGVTVNGSNLIVFVRLTTRPS